MAAASIYADIPKLKSMLDKGFRAISVGRSQYVSTRTRSCRVATISFGAILRSANDDSKVAPTTVASSNGASQEGVVVLSPQEITKPASVQ